MMLPIDYTKANWSERRAARKEYVRMQKGKCHFCNGDLTELPDQKKLIDWRLFPKNFTRHPVHLHHCHDTGMTIGAVHAYCNAVLWQYHGE